jgi:hypothetical protein
LLLLMFSREHHLTPLIPLPRNTDKCAICRRTK